MFKRAGIFYFQDEPQFAGYESRAWLAHYLRACRSSRGNMGCKRYAVTRAGFGKYTVRLNTSDSPTAVILTRPGA